MSRITIDDVINYVIKMAPINDDDNNIVDGEHTGKLEIGIKENKSLTTLLTLKVLEFPMIKFLWFGVVVTFIGFIMSIVQRVKKLKPNI